jgi:hypothetical protein
MMPRDGMSDFVRRCTISDPCGDRLEFSDHQSDWRAPSDSFPDEDVIAAARCEQLVWLTRDDVKEIYDWCAHVLVGRNVGETAARETKK